MASEIAGIDSLSPELIRSLRVLGLSNYEARVFATLVLLDSAEVREIIDFLSLAKPSVYEALEGLAGRGLVIKQQTKPARYTAVSPGMAITLLLEEHERASEEALLALKSLEREKVRTDREEVVWTIYGDANIKYKIREMVLKARNHISCVMGDHYVRFLDQVSPRNIPLNLTVLSSSPDLEEKLRKKFGAKSSEIRVIPLERFRSPPPEFLLPGLAEAWKYLQFENVLELNIDDEEMLWGQAFLKGTGSVMNTHNKGAIAFIKLIGALLWEPAFWRDACPEGAKKHG
jgi:sugar-specific transcriptional regulator TrmB